MEGLIRRRVTKSGVIVGLLSINILIWPLIFTDNQSKLIEFLDIGRNRAAIFSTTNGEIVGCFDFYIDSEDAERTIIPFIMNNYDGRLDYLISSTPESENMRKIIAQFSPQIVTLDDLLAQKNGDKVNSDKNIDLLPIGAKVVWDQTDNTEQGKDTNPVLQVKIGEDILLLAGWGCKQSLNGFQLKDQVSVMELPWSEYARKSCREKIDHINASFVVFSPDRYSVTAPRNPFELTHSMDRILSASIYGGFTVKRLGGNLHVESMKPVVGEEITK
jgi:hypothetical protein